MYFNCKQHRNETESQLHIFNSKFGARIRQHIYIYIQWTATSSSGCGSRGTRSSNNKSKHVFLHFPFWCKTHICAIALRKTKLRFSFFCWCVFFRLIYNAFFFKLVLQCGVRVYTNGKSKPKEAQNEYYDEWFGLQKCGCRHEHRQHSVSLVLTACAYLIKKTFQIFNWIERMTFVYTWKCREAHVRRIAWTKWQNKWVEILFYSIEIFHDTIVYWLNWLIGTFPRHIMLIVHDFISIASIALLRQQYHVSF